MTRPTYYMPQGGLPNQSELISGRARFTTAYAVIPKAVMTDIVTSRFPFWEKTRAWILSKPLSGFAETFSQYIMEVQPDGGSKKPETDAKAEAVLFVTGGEITLMLEGKNHLLKTGSYAFIAPSANWQIKNRSEKPAQFHWIRKAYEAVEGIDYPTSFISSEKDATTKEMRQEEGVWQTTHFVENDDMRHDMQVNIVSFKPGASIPFAETHVMEHGLYVLQGKGVYRLNQDWVEVEAGDYMWLRAFCPQACYAGGPEPFRYLLYKNINRHMPL